MKEPALAINEGSVLIKGFIHNVNSPMVLSKRSLIHSNSFQQKIKLYLKLVLVERSWKRRPM